MKSYLGQRLSLRLRILRLLSAARAPLVSAALAIQVLTGLAAVAFIVGTSVVVGRVPGAVAGGLDSPEWRSLQNALLLAGILFLLQQVSWPFQWAFGELITWRVDDAVRERVATASFAPVGITALEDQKTLDELAEIADPHRGDGFSPGAACAGMLALVYRYVQWLVASVFIGFVYEPWAAVAVGAGALAIRVGIRSGLGRMGAFEESFASARRRRDYYRNTLSATEAAKEIRIFGLLPWLQDPP